MKLIFDVFARMNCQVDCHSRVVWARTRLHTRDRPAPDSYVSAQSGPVFAKLPG